MSSDSPERDAKIEQGRRNRSLLLFSFVYAAAIVAVLKSPYGLTASPGSNASLAFLILVFAIGVTAASLAWVQLIRSLGAIGFRALLQPPVLLAVLLLVPTLVAAPEIAVLCWLIGPFWESKAKLRPTPSSRERANTPVQQPGGLGVTAEGTRE